MRVLKLLRLALIASIFSVSLAQAHSGFGVVDMARIFHDAPQVQALKKQMEQQFAKQRIALMQERAAIQAAYKTLDRNKQVMSSKERGAKSKSLYERTSVLQKKEVAFQQAVQKDQDDFMNHFVSMVKDMVKVIAKKEHFQLVLIKSTVAYAEDDMDITTQVLHQLEGTGGSKSSIEKSSAAPVKKK